MARVKVSQPRGVTYKVTCRQWLTIGAWARRTLPTICIQRCSVFRVAVHAEFMDALASLGLDIRIVENDTSCVLNFGGSQRAKNEDESTAVDGWAPNVTSLRPSPIADRTDSTSPEWLAELVSTLEGVLSLAALSPASPGPQTRATRPGA